MTTSTGYTNVPHQETKGEKLASLIPGSRAHEQHHPTSATGTTAGYGTSTGPTTAHTGATGTTTSGGGIASKIPGTKQYEATHPHAGTTGATGTTGAYGSSHTDSGLTGSTATGAHTGAHTTHGTSSTHGGGIASKIPGTQAHAATHDHQSQHAHNLSQSTGLQPGAPGTTTTTTTMTVPKPSAGDKISGKIDVAIGKMTHNPGKVAVGEIKQTEGKAGLANAGLGTHGATGTGHTVGAGAGSHTTGRY